MPREWKARQGEELHEHLAYASANDQRPGRSKDGRCRQGKSVKGLCVHEWVQVGEVIDPKYTDPLDYAAHAIRTLPERIQAVIEAGRDLGLELEDYKP